MSLRGHGRILFADIQDETGKIQLFFQEKNLGKDKFKILKLIDRGDFIGVEGKVIKTSAGEITIDIKDFQLLTKALRPLPDKWHGLKDTEERFRKRYLDILLDSKVRNSLRIRSNVVSSIRNFLEKKGFIEVETPVLQPIYGGAFARPFTTHHNALNSQFYLRISDEMYLKRLIVGGFEKVYEITKVFRNEGIDQQHNPEFTMFEAMIAFKDYKYGMDLIEKIIEHAAIKVLGTTELKYQGKKFSFKRPWEKLRLVEAIQKYTKIDPLTWKTVKDARNSLQNIKLNETKHKELSAMTSIGEIINFTFEELVEEKLIQPIIIYDYPVEISPLAKKCKDPRFTQRFEMFAFGSELGNNYSELTDAVDLKKRFIEEKKREEAGFEEAHQIDYDYLEAIEQGFPPTCGIAIGIDRLIKLFTDSKSIREIIAFPLMKPKIKQKKKSRTTKPKTQTKVTMTKSTKKNYPNRQKYLNAVKSELETNIFFHSLTLEACMGGIYDYLKENNHIDDNEPSKEDWLLAGLVHDIDYSGELKDQHPANTKQILAKHNLEISDLVHQIVLAHDGREKIKYDSKAKWAILCADSLTGLIVAVALVYPSKKLADVKLSSITKRFKKEPRFAAGTRREEVMLCEKKDGLNIPIDKFIEVCFLSMQSIADQIRL